MTEPVIRPARDADLPLVAALEQELFGREAWDPSALESELDAPGRTLLVATDGAEVVGWIALMVVGEVADLLRLGVPPSRQRQGVAGALLLRALELARAAGAQRLLLEVSEANRAARAFYAAHGLAEIDRRPRYYRDASDAVILRLPLGP